MIGKRHDVSTISDPRGKLSVIEFEKLVTFPIKRVYWLFDTNPGKTRGAHAHKALQQLLVCLRGSVEVILDNGKEKETHILDSPNVALEIFPGTWRDIVTFVDSPIVMCFASELFSENDYIRNYEEFLNYAHTFS